MSTMRRKKEGGFTLLEMLLTVSVLAATLLLITRLFEDSARNSLYDKNAVYFDTVMNEAVNMVNTMSEFDRIYALLQRPTTLTVMEVPITNDPVNAGVNPYGITLQDGSIVEGILPSPVLTNTAFSEISPVGTRLSVIFHVMDAIGDPNDERIIGVYVVGVDPIAERQVRPIVTAMGAGGGFISEIEERPGVCLPISCNRTIRNAQYMWRNELDFPGTRFQNQVLNITTGAAFGVRGYIVNFRFINESEIAGDYLYRLPQLSNPDLNTMNTGIEMSGNNLVGVDNIVLEEDLDVQENTTIFAKGSIFTEGRLSMEGGDVFVSGDAEMSTLNVGPAYNDGGLNIPTRNQISVEDTIFTTNMEIQNNLVADRGDISNSLLAPSILTNTATVGTVNANNSVGVFSTTSQTTNMNVAGVARTGASVSNTNPLNVIAGDTGTFEVLSQGDATLNQGVDANFVRFNNVDIGILEQCLAGC